MTNIEEQLAKAIERAEKAEKELSDIQSKQCLLCNGSMKHHNTGCKGAIPWDELYSNHVALGLRLEKAESACAEMRNALEHFKCGTCHGTHKFTPECNACLIGEGTCECDLEEEMDCPQCTASPGLGQTLTVEYAALEHALSSDCGQGWLSPEKSKIALGVLAKIALGSGCYCECNQPVELCECAGRIARQAITDINSK